MVVLHLFVAILNLFVILWVMSRPKPQDAKPLNLTYCQDSVLVFLKASGQGKRLPELFSQLTLWDSPALRQAGHQNCHSQHDQQSQLHAYTLCDGEKRGKFKYCSEKVWMRKCKYCSFQVVCAAVFSLQ